LQEIENRGAIRFGMFYARRLRRLLPGLLLMLVCTAMLGRLLIAPGEQPEQASAAASAALWLSKLLFAFVHLDYFSPGSATNLVLHAWSLGVEEQFYLVWPLLLVLATGAAARGHVHAAAARVRAAMAVVLAASALLCAWWMRGEPALAFYMMPARAW